MESTTLCLSCGERGHGVRKCPALAAPLKNGFYSGGGGGGGHGGDDEDERLSKKLTPVPVVPPTLYDGRTRTRPTNGSRL